jgi:hypothetical protein
MHLGYHSYFLCAPQKRKEWWPQSFPLNPRRTPWMHNKVGHGLAIGSANRDVTHVGMRTSTWRVVSGPGGVRLPCKSPCTGPTSVWSVATVDLIHPSGWTRWRSTVWPGRRVRRRQTAGPAAPLPAAGWTRNSGRNDCQRVRRVMITSRCPLPTGSSASVRLLAARELDHAAVVGAPAVRGSGEPRRQAGAHIRSGCSCGCS